jgi:hypothetical protein
MRAGNIGDVARSIGASSPAFQYGQEELSRREQRVSYFEVDDARTEGGGGIEIRDAWRDTRIGRKSIFFPIRVSLTWANLFLADPNYAS